MTSRRVPSIRAVLTLGLLLATAAAAGERVEKTLAHTEPVAPGTHLVVENLIGSVTIRAVSAPGAVGVRARVVAEGKEPEDAQALADSVAVLRRSQGGYKWLHIKFPVDRHPALRVPREGKSAISKFLSPLLRRGKVATEYEGRRVEIGNARGVPGLAVHLELAVPRDMQLSVRQIVGGIDCARWRGRLSLETLDGDVRVSQLYGSLQATTGEGEVAVKSFKGDEVTIHTGAGDMELVDVDAEQVVLRTEDGRVRGRLVTAALLRVETGSGDVSLEETEPASFEMRTGSGSVNLGTRLRRARGGSISSASGNVTLEVGELTSFDLETRTESGSVKVHDLPLELLGDDDGGLTRYRHRGGGRSLRITTDSGNVVLRAL